MVALRGQIAREPLLYGYLALVLASLAAAAALTSPLPLVAPVGALVALVGLRDVRLALLVTVAAIPLSTEVQFGSLGTDLPGEPLMWFVTGLTGLYYLRRSRTIDGALWRHPVTLALLLHLVWIVVTTLTSAYVLTSVKWTLAKLWYVLPFYFLAAVLLRGPGQVRRLTAFIAVPLTVVLAYCLSRHASMGFSFDLVNKAMHPFFRGHVNYAALTSILLPWLVLGALLRERGSAGRRWFWVASVICLFAIQTSYTRAAYVSLFIGAAFLLVVRWRLTRYALALAGLVVVGIGVSLVQDNRFFNFAPDYNKTVSHQDFGNLLEATYKLEDISTMERVYRWVAGSYMAGERPEFGFGPGNFYRFYKGYALESFRTYVSDNPDKSGIHSYLLMLLVEQGWVGLLVFVGLCVAGIMTVERAFHRLREREDRLVIMAAGASLVINLSFQLINDLIESDKSGPWLFLSLAIIVALDVKARRLPHRESAA